MMDVKLKMENEKSQQLFKRTCFVCVVTCMFVCGCCVYCTVLLGQIRAMTARCETRVAVHETNLKIGPDQIEVVNHNVEDDPGFVPGTPPEVRNKRAATNSTEAARKAIRKAIESTKAGTHKVTDKNKSKDANDSQKKKDKKKRRKKKTRTKAVHFQSVPKTISTPKQAKNATIDMVKVIQSFLPAKWVVDKNSPFTMKDDGLFKARYTGLYLIYAQVLFYDNKEAEVLRLVQVRNDRLLGAITIQSLTCSDSIDRDGPLRYTSCGVTGLFHINSGDIVFMENMLKDVTINKNLSTTYFGAMLLK